MDWYSGSLLPPDVDEFADTNPPKSCLLDRKPFLGNRTNATTARCIIEDDLDDDMAIQVSFFAVRPPHVSYILAWSFGTYFTEEPRVVSTDGGLVLLTFAVHSESLPFSEYYVYQPGAPSLDLIPQPRGNRLVDQYCRAGLLSLGGGSGSGGYHVVTLTMGANGEFDLHVFSSDTQNWTIKKPVLSQEDGAPKLANYMTYKAIALGGGSMAFVDLWNGILICDVLDGGESPELCYLPLPSTELCQPSSTSLKPRDITISVSGDTICFKLAEVVYPPASEAWCTDMWIATSMATSPWRQLKGWHKESADGSELVVAKGLSLDGLLDLSYADAEPTLGCLFVDKPMLSLDQDNIVCFMAKKHIRDSQAWVIAVDMAKKKLQGVNRLEVGRSSELFFSTISGHLATSAASGDLKRHWPLLESYPHKKHLHGVSSSVGEHDQGFMGAHDWDAMDLEHGERV